MRACDLSKRQSDLYFLKMCCENIIKNCVPEDVLGIICRLDSLRYWLDRVGRVVSVEMINVDCINHHLDDFIMVRDGEVSGVCLFSIKNMLSVLIRRIDDVFYNEISVKKLTLEEEYYSRGREIIG